MAVFSRIDKCRVALFVQKICVVVYNSAMFSDTHFHFRHLVRDRGLDGAKILSELAANDTFFALDIGTEADDLIERQAFVSEAMDELPPLVRTRAEAFVHYSAGIWPSPEEIRDRDGRMKVLAEKISRFERGGGKVVAIGECGLDHHWNQAGADGRSADEFDGEMLEGERELFEMQLELAKEMDLPVVVHSREAFGGTVDAMENVGWNRGVIHCYSYGIAEARIFLNMGWHIAFGGAVTYAKKKEAAAMRELLRFVPDDMILLETDSPYLAPVPYRGQVNTPARVETVCRFVADARGIPAERLSGIVDDNIRALFALA